MEVYIVDVTVYTDTSMGGNNASYTHRNPYSTLEAAKKGIIKDLKGRRERWVGNFPIEDFEIKLHGGKWSHDFVPEIVTVTKTKVL